METNLKHVVILEGFLSCYILFNMFPTKPHSLRHYGISVSLRSLSMVSLYLYALYLWYLCISMLYIYDISVSLCSTYMISLQETRSRLDASTALPMMTTGFSTATELTLVVRQPNSHHITNCITSKSSRACFRMKCVLRYSLTIRLKVLKSIRVFQLTIKAS